jgi:hypothetical protein
MLTRVEPSGWLPDLRPRVTRVEVTEIGKHSSFLGHDKNYCRKSFTVQAPGAIFTTLFNGLNKLKSYSALSWIGLPGTNALTYWAHSSVMKKMKCCNSSSYIKFAFSVAPSMIKRAFPVFSIFEVFYFPLKTQFFYPRTLA